MPVHVLTNVGIWMDGYDLSGVLRGVSLEHVAELQDKTVFGNTTRMFMPGLKHTRARVEGFWDASGTTVPGGAPERPIFDTIGTEGTVFSYAPVRTAGQPAHTFQAAQAEYELGGQLGELLQFSASAEASATPPLVKGVLLADVSGATSSSTTTKFQAGAVAAGKRMWAALHVTSVSGTNPTLDVVVQSDANSSAGGETGRITFSQATGLSAQFSSVAGSVTDTWWRTSYTIGGTGTPTFSFAVIIGVL